MTLLSLPSLQRRRRLPPVTVTRCYPRRWKWGGNKSTSRRPLPSAVLLVATGRALLHLGTNRVQGMRAVSLYGPGACEAHHGSRSAPPEAYTVGGRILPRTKRWCAGRTPYPMPTRGACRGRGPWVDALEVESYSRSSRSTFSSCRLAAFSSSSNNDKNESSTHRTPTSQAAVVLH